MASHQNPLNLFASPKSVDSTEEAVDAESATVSEMPGSRLYPVISPIVASGYSLRKFGPYLRKMKLIHGGYYKVSVEIPGHAGSLWTVRFAKDGNWGFEIDSFVGFENKDHYYVLKGHFGFLNIGMVNLAYYGNDKGKGAVRIDKSGDIDNGNQITLQFYVFFVTK